MKNNRFSFPFPQALPSATVALGAALTLALLSGCSALPKFTELQAEAATPTAETKLAQQSAPAPLPDPEPPKKTKLFEWTGKGRAVTRIVVDVDEQKARFYEGDKEVGWTMVASGVSKFPTPVGRFSVTEKVTNKESNLYGKIYGKGGQLISSNAKMGKTPIPTGARFDGADMPYYMRLTGDGIGMHAGPIPNPGRPASHGCIRMPKAFAPIAFRHVGVGTEVSIVGNGPSYATYLAQQRAQAARSVAATKPAAPKAQAEAGGTPSPAATAAVGTESAASGAAGAAVVATASGAGCRRDGDRGGHSGGGRAQSCSAGRGYAGRRQACGSDRYSGGGSGPRRGVASSNGFGERHSGAPGGTSDTRHGAGCAPSGCNGCGGPGDPG